MSQCCYVTMLLCHKDGMLTCCYVTRMVCHDVAMSQGWYVTILLCHKDGMSQCCYVREREVYFNSDTIHTETYNAEKTQLCMHTNSLLTKNMNVYVQFYHFSFSFSKCCMYITADFVSLSVLAY
jgi:hypothetical protein